MIQYYLTLFVVAMVATWWIFKKVLRIALMKNIVDNPDARKLQKVLRMPRKGHLILIGRDCRMVR